MGRRMLVDGGEVAAMKTERKKKKRAFSRPRLQRKKKKNHAQNFSTPSLSLHAAPAPVEYTYAAPAFVAWKPLKLEAPAME